MSHNIVITIPSISFKEAKALLKYYEFCELRIDLIDWTLTEIKEFISQAKKIIVTYHPIVSDQQRLDVLRHLNWSQVDFFDLELDCDDEYEQICHELLLDSRTELIRSYHNYRTFESPEVILGRFDISTRDILKIAVPVANDDELESLILSYELHPRIILIGMGEEGIDSRYKAEELGAPFMYCYPDGYEPVAPGQLSYSQLSSYHKQLQTEYSFVVGKPIIHSKSPQIFNQAFGKNEHEGRYSRLFLDSLGELNEIREQLPLGLINITSPFKYTTSEIGISSDNPINTLAFDDSWHGSNTDQNATELLDFSSARKVLIVGSGGAAEAAIIGLTDKDCDRIAITARRDKAVSRLSQKYQIENINWSMLLDEISKFDTIIWTIPSAIFVDKQLSFAKAQQVLDVNYRNSLKDLGVVNHITSYKSGLDWLIAQAVPNLVKYFHIENPSVIDHEEAIANDHLSKTKKLCFIGLPYSGKSNITRILASKTGKKWIDLDQEIAASSGKSIPQIFKEEGEPEFRDLERSLVVKTLEYDDFILATGGGIVEDYRNREDLKENCFVIFLLMKPETAIGRFDGNRPLLEGNSLEKLTAIHNRRLPLYLEIADAVIDVNSRTIEEIVERVYEELCSVK